jgi:large subunit ribosomal protein L21
VVDRVSADVGPTVKLDSVLMVSGDDQPMVGTPFVQGAAVEATVVNHRSGDKIIVFKFQARKRRRRKIGHRQQLSELRIGSISAPGDRHPGSPSKEAEAADATQGQPATKTEKAPRRRRKAAAFKRPTTEA